MKDLADIMQRFGELYSEELGIDLSNTFEWLVASILFGNRISTTIAKKTFRVYRDEGLLSPESLSKALWEDLVRVDGKGGYVRYDGITATYMRAMAEKVLADYGGEISRLDEVSDGPRDLERRLLELKGVGPVTARIFLRELRGIWRNADPDPTSIEVAAARALGFIKEDTQSLRDFWERNAVPGYDFRNFEAALVRIGLPLRRGRRLKDILGNCG